MNHAGVIVVAALLLASGASAADETPRIPFVVGLTTVSVTTSKLGDHENLRVIDAIRDTSYRVVVTGEVPLDSGDGFMDADIPRVVRFADQVHSRNVRVAWHTMDRESMTGNVPGISCDIFQDLRRFGDAELAFLDLTMAAMFPMNTPYKGRVSVVERTPVTVLVNRMPRALPSLRVKGTLTSAEGQRRDLDAAVLDDPDNPLLLQVAFGSARARVNAIEYPLPDADLERALAGAAPVELTGIHFAFASSRLRAESSAALARIAAVLREHPDWRFRIEGHTDSIGEAAANLQLATRRAVAVQTALVSPLGVPAAQLTATGFGENRPLAGNDTESGRARNRRVELVRIGSPAPVEPRKYTKEPARTACPRM